MTPDHQAFRRALPAYDIGPEIGRGAFGVVFAGRHRQLGRDVAIKQLSAELSADPDIRERFVTEARVLALLDHPHIVPVYDFVEHEGLCLLVMERLPGGSLYARLRAGGLTPQQSCAAAIATCSALDYAHARGILHRDIKPDNLLFSAAGVLKVTDFGVAKIVGGRRAAQTRAGAVLGTPLYMSPEQASGGEINVASDVYATGVLLYHLLAGRLPFPQLHDPVAVVHQRIHSLPESLHDVAPDVPAGLADAVMRAIAREPESRYASTASLARAIDEAASDAWGPGWLAASGLPVVPPRGAADEPATEGVSSGGGKREVASSSSDPASRTVTLLFTDLVGSTELYERVGDARADELRREHFELLREQVHACGGEEVKNTGDGLMVAFGSAASAASCALGMQKAVTAHAGDEDLQIRIGVHAGEPMQEQRDYFGTAVNLAQRLCAAAGPARILVSDSVRWLLYGRADVELRSVGRLTLKGISEPVLAWELVWAPERAGTVMTDSIGRHRRRLPSVRLLAGAIVAVVAVVLGGLLLTGAACELGATTFCEDAGSASPSPPSEPSPATTLPRSFDEPALGVSGRLPAGWLRETHDWGVVWLDPHHVCGEAGRSCTGIVFALDPVPDGDLAQAYQASRVAEYADYALVAIDRTAVDGREALRHEFTATIDGVGVRVTEHLVTGGDRLVRISAYAAETVFHDVRPTLEDVVETLRLS